MIQYFKTNWLNVLAFLGISATSIWAFMQSWGTVCMPVYVLLLICSFTIGVSTVISYFSFIHIRRKDMDSVFAPGLTVKHKFTRELFIVVKRHPWKRNTLICRREDYSYVNFHVKELLMII